MAQQHGKSMLDKVKRSFLRMTSPFEFGGEEEHFNTVLSMNVPSMLARTDAAHEKAVKMVHYNVFSHTDRERKDLYEAILRLLGAALENIEEIQSILDAEKRTLNVSAFVVYLRYLNKIFSLLLDLTTRQENIDVDEKELNGFFGNGIVTPFRNADTAFSESELEIFHFILELIDAVEPGMTRTRELYKKVLTKTDLGRYAKAYSEYVAIYAKYDPQYQRASEES